jgi:hypothetical protein
MLAAVLERRNGNSWAVGSQWDRPLTRDCTPSCTNRMHRCNPKVLKTEFNTREQSSQAAAREKGETNYVNQNIQTSAKCRHRDRAEAAKG